MTKSEQILMKALLVAQEALENYADPASYHAIAFFTDPPAGWFSEDFGPADETDYGRPMPGFGARQALQEIDEILGQEGKELEGGGDNATRNNK